MKCLMTKRRMFGLLASILEQERPALAIPYWQTVVERDVTR